jgi:hypothetical protein
MTILSIIRDGLRRATAAPQLLLFLWLFNFAMALPLALALSAQIESSLGASRIQEKLRHGFDIDWYEEFSHNANDLGKTFSPAVIGVGPFLGNLEAWLNGSLFAGNPGIIGLGIGYMIVWMFLLGGVLDRFARRDEPLLMEQFFHASGRYILRFISLFLLAAVFYFFIFASVAPALFSFIANATRDTTVEHNVFFLTASAYALIALLLATVNMVFDYAKIATVVKGHRNMFVAAVDGLRFVLAHPAKTFGLYLVLGIFLMVALGLYSLIAPGAGQASGLAIFLAFLVGQIFLALKLILRLTFFGGQMALYETTLESPAPAMAESLSY